VTAILCWAAKNSLRGTNTIFMQLNGNILEENFFYLKDSINRQINGNLEPLKDFGINFSGSPSDIFKHILEND
jgi:hypothetical protein